MIFALLAAALIIAAAVAGSKFEPVLRSRYKRTVVVTCKSGQAWRGVLHQSDRSTIVLRNAEMIGGQSPVLVDGEVLLPRDTIEFVQKP